MCYLCVVGSVQYIHYIKTTTHINTLIAAELSMISKNSPIGGAVSPPLHLGTNDTNDRSLVAARLRVASSGASCVGAFVA